MNIFTPIKILIQGHAPEQPDDKPAPLRVAPTIKEQDEYFGVLQELGITHGKPGSWSDEYVREKIQSIENCNSSQSVKYHALDALYFGVQNNHADGVSAKVNNEVMQAIDRIQGY
jgi:hypothetical protein